MGTKVELNNSELNTENKLEKKREEAIKWLDENFGKHKNGIVLSKKQLNKIALEMTPKKSRQIAKEFGFE